MKFLINYEILFWLLMYNEAKILNIINDNKTK